MTSKPGLIHQLTLRIAATVVVALATLTGLWVAAEYSQFTATAEKARADGEERLRTQLRYIVDDAIALIEVERRSTEARVERIIRDRVDEAHAIAANVVRTAPPGEPREVVAAHVREALRPIRFNDGRGYFFAFDMAGIEQLFAARPELEGKDMLGMTGARGEFVVRDMLDIVKAQGEGFYRYYWTQPGKPGDDHLKIAYVKKLEALDWVIGTGEYVEDMEAAIQAEMLARLSKLHFADTGYLFAGRFDGTSLAGPLAGRNVLAEGPPEAAAIVAQLIDTARAGGGHIVYDVPRNIGLAPVRKVSYVAPVADWDWYVGTGTALDAAEALIGAEAEVLRRGMLIKVAIGAAVAVALLGAILAFIRAAAIRAARDTADLDQGLAAASATLLPLDAESLTFAEHHRVALAANRLIERRREAEDELREHGRQLERINDDLERFAYVASHDLQEPLRTVRLFLQLLEKRLAGKLDDECREYIAFAVQGAERMRANILGLLAYSRANADGERSMQVDVAELLRPVLDDLRGAIEAAGAAVTVGAMPSVAGEPAQLAAVFQNLIGNALRYRHPDRPPRVEVSARPLDGGEWEFAVADNGIGIPEEYREAVFEPFRRFNQPGYESGTGIGLALCRRVIEKHGGRIRAQSDHTGTTMIFTLPGFPLTP
ncbi:cache domain-containing protein [Magnetospirillum sp. UT-4]|uniref:cache domain-containing protein n=1 Tax=Magnetospirillum sp. UT-4 TaxID=2681467 RepID=UPI001382E0FD|nr:cache domain-containing protein [Magnetospirillum sp. UT-4]CAA7616538.1 Signal transduction histidine kinase [Magnetospirillum sp. UT-4]